MHAFRSVILLFLCFCFLPNPTFAQTQKIRGSVKNKAQEALGLASVNLVDENNLILAYTTSDKQGLFVLNYSKPENTNSLSLQVSYLGYRKQSKSVLPEAVNYQFVLVQDSTLLEEVIVHRKPPIVTHGDTLSYDVKSFSQKEDRSIGDVLKRLPGIEIDPDGSIYHNNKKVENLYIQGDDLMSGRYGLATRAIRKEMISRVDIMNDHQPIEVLKNKIASDKTAINLVLDDEKNINLSTEVNAATGLPHNYELAATPILLNSEFKLLSTIAMNNIGTDYKGDFKQLGSANFTSTLLEDQNIPNLSLGTAPPPDVPLNNYYLNASKVANVNVLRKNSKGLTFKVNMQGFTDSHSLEYANRTENYLPNDTVVYIEEQFIRNRPNMLQGSFTLTDNQANHFFSNSLTFFISGENNKSEMSFNDYSFNQTLRKRRAEFSNDLNWIPKLPGRGIGEIRWLLNYGQNKDILDIGNGFILETSAYAGLHDAVSQRVYTPRIYSNAYLSYKFIGDILHQVYNVGIIHEKQDLQSRLDLFPEGQPRPYQLDGGNAIRWNKQIAYFSPEYQLKFKKILSTVKIPLNYQHIRYQQSQGTPHSKHTDVYLNPSIDIRYALASENVIRTHYSIRHMFGHLSDIYSGNILTNYQTLHRNEADLQTKQINTVSLSYDYQKSIKLLFANISLSSDKIRTDNILSTVYEDNIQNAVLLPYKNQMHITRLNTGLSKYVFSVKSTLAINLRLQRSSFDQLINNVIQPFITDGIRINGTIKRQLFGIHFDYGNTATWNFTKSPPVSNGSIQPNYRMFRIDQTLTLSTALSESFRLTMNNKHSYGRQSNVEYSTKYFFSDLKVSHIREKNNLHIDLDLFNIFNVKEYRLLSMDAFQLYNNNYKLRGRMLLLRCNYLF